MNSDGRSETSIDGRFDVQEDGSSALAGSSAAIALASVSLSSTVTFLFTDIEGSTRLWEQEPERMPLALARHDALARAAVESNRGIVVKMVGDGLHAAFDDPLDALNATLAMQRALTDAGATNGVALRVRCGLHAGTGEHRDN